MVTRVARWYTLLALSSLLLLSCESLGSISARSVPQSMPDRAVPDRPIADRPLPPAPASTSARSRLWSDDFSQKHWATRWQIRDHGRWGEQNAQVIPDSSRRFSHVLRVQYPAGSASPDVTRKDNTPLGGTQFFANLGLSTHDRLHLSYFVRFSPGFEFVKGGKLPGLYGGRENNGGKIPDGTNGFSTRYMWRKNGAGEIYAYLPTSQQHGTSIGRGAWQFRPGLWYHLEQEVVLNDPERRNGQIRVWVNGQPVLSQTGLQFRTTDRLQIEGILFSTFFGGGDSSWATPKTVYADFAKFSVSAVP